MGRSTRGEEPVDETVALATVPASDSEPAASGFVVLPRGAFVGLDVSHDRRHMTRAVLEGVAFGLRDGLELMVAAGNPRPTQIRASGGGLVNPLWRQILADVLRAEIALPTTTEGAAYGAAICAAVGTGWFASIEEATNEVVVAEPVAAPSDLAAQYHEWYSAYRDLYPAVAPWFQRGRAQGQSLPS